jgi:hypothetical protein
VPLLMPLEPPTTRTSIQDRGSAQWMWIDEAECLIRARAPSVDTGKR